MAEDDDDAPTAAPLPPPPPLQKRVLSRSHGSRAATPARSQDLPPVPSRTARDSGPHSGDVT